MLGSTDNKSSQNRCTKGACPNYFGNHNVIVTLSFYPPPPQNVMINIALIGLYNFICIYAYLSMLQNFLFAHSTFFSPDMLVPELNKSLIIVLWLLTNGFCSLQDVAKQYGLFQLGHICCLSRLPCVESCKFLPAHKL